MTQEELRDILGLFGDDILKRKTRKRRKSKRHLKRGQRPYVSGELWYRQFRYGNVRAEYASRLKGREAGLPVHMRPSTTPDSNLDFFVGMRHSGPYHSIYSR